MQCSPLRWAVLLALAAVVLGAPSWYTCDPNTCVAPDCHCAGSDPPAVGGVPLPLDQIPQLIIFTHDDAVVAETNAGMRAIIDQHTNRNGCNVPATFFVLEYGNDCALAKAFWEENSEIAVHTVSHAQLVDPFTGIRTLEEEMLGARTYLNETCGIPLEDMVGFRCPLLYHNPPVRQVLADNGMLYDSSILEKWPSDMSPNATNRLWPYTMDSGIPQDCAYFGNVCTQQESYPGMWEFPLLETQGAAGELLYSMDPGRSFTSGGTDLSSDEVLAMLKSNFDSSYYGNRSPYGLYVHTPWLTEANINATNQLLDYALSLPDTWVVTMRQAIQWMQAPVPASNMSDWLICKPVDLSTAPGAEKCQVYTAVSGDYGSVIAGKFGVAEEDLLALNPNIGKLAVGDKVFIPPFDSTCGDGIPSTGPAGAAAVAVTPTATTPTPTTAPTVVAIKSATAAADGDALSPLVISGTAATSDAASQLSAVPQQAQAPAPSSGAGSRGFAAAAALLAAAAAVLALAA